MIGTTEATILCIFLAALLIGWSTQATKDTKTEGATELPPGAFTAADSTNFWMAAALRENEREPSASTSEVAGAREMEYLAAAYGNFPRHQ